MTKLRAFVSGAGRAAACRHEFLLACRFGHRLWKFFYTGRVSISCFSLKRLVWGKIREMAQFLSWHKKFVRKGMRVAGCGFWVAKLQVVISGSGQVSLYAVAVCLLWIIALWGAGYWLQVSGFGCFGVGWPPHFDLGSKCPSWRREFVRPCNSGSCLVIGCSNCVKGGRAIRGVGCKIIINCPFSIVNCSRWLKKLCFFNCVSISILVAVCPCGTVLWCLIQGYKEWPKKLSTIHFQLSIARVGWKGCIYLIALALE